MYFINRKQHIFISKIKIHILLLPSSIRTYEHSLLYRTGFRGIHVPSTTNSTPISSNTPFHSKYHIISQSTFTHVYLEEFDVCDYRYCTELHIFKRIWPHVEYIITLGEKSIYAMRASSTSSFSNNSTYYNIQQNIYLHTPKSKTFSYSTFHTLTTRHPSLYQL